MRRPDFIKSVLLLEKAFYGHAGRPGQVGGSVPASSAMSRTTGYVAVKRMRGRGGSKIAAANPEPETVANPGSRAPGQVPADFTGNYFQEDSHALSRETYADALKLCTKDWNPFNDPQARFKHDLVTFVSMRAGVDYEVANDIIKNWTISANDSDPRSLNLQADAAEELGLELSDWQKERIANIPEWKDDQRLHPAEVQKRVVRAMYEMTQERLQTLGFKDSVVLWRGVGGDKRFRNGTTDYHGNAVESWSMDRGAANIFAKDFNEKDFGAVFVMEVPVKNIVSTYFSGWGCSREDEFVIMGNLPGQQAMVFETAEKGAEY